MRMQAGPKGPQDGGSGLGWALGQEGSPFSSQVIWGTGVPCTEHRSTKSWPSMTVQSFRTLDNEGATSIVASSSRAKNRQAVSDHSWPILAEDYSHLTSFRQTPHCPVPPGLPWRPGFVLSIFTLNFPLQRPGVCGSETCRGFSPSQNTGGLDMLRTWACPSPLGLGTSCIILPFAMLEHPQSSSSCLLWSYSIF